MPLRDAARVPASTFRVQLHAGFTFDDLREQLPFLRGLGITDVYLSPIFTAASGSLHGYDVNDYRELNPELGGEAGFERLAEALRGCGTGALVDFVPNHMGIAGSANGWWRDVLERGERSPYAAFFDIQWNASGGRGMHRVLVPILADHYGTVLERGEITLVYAREFGLQTGELVLPVSPATTASLLEWLERAGELPEAEEAVAGELWTLFAAAGTSSSWDRAGYERLKERLSRWVGGTPAVRAAVDRRLAQLNGTRGDPSSFSGLNELIEAQHYRLSRWKTGAHEINYRRFFAIDTLIGMRMENPELFAAAHERLAKLIEAGAVTGLRIDHVDGLRRPEEYLQRLQALPRPGASRPLYVTVEKILAGGERLELGWATHGTTGYEFIAQLAGLLVNPAAEQRLTETYVRFTGDVQPYPDALYAKKRLVLEELFADAVATLGGQLADFVAEDWRWQDMTRHELVIALRELIAGLSVYRTYRTDGAASEADTKVVDAALASAIARNPRFDPQPFRLVRDVLVGAYPSPRAPPAYRHKLREWVLTLQQYTGAVMAKATEDTVFYTYNRLVALNEVGGNPGDFGASVPAFHEANLARCSSAPLSMLATSTHDSKWSEDVRARLYALTELAAPWDEWVTLWHALNGPHLTRLEGGDAPDAIDEYRFYQALIGTWPLSPEELNHEYRERLRTHLRKAVDEAKRHTSSVHPNERYLEACDRFVSAITTPATAEPFLSSFAPCAQRVARLGLVNSLTQLVLKCTVPGVPDFYQGNELWDFSMVDPDNRRPVDFQRRRALAGDLEQASLPSLLESWKDGRLKMRVMQGLLRLREAQPALFHQGDYRPLSATGAFADRVVAFRRDQGKARVLVVVPRLSAEIGIPPLGVAWDDTALVAGGEERWVEVFSGRTFQPGAGAIPLSELMAEAPFAVLSAGKSS